MKTTLRDHPLLKEHGVRNWPPTWFWTGRKRSNVLTGEFGILKDVKTHDSISSKCFLFMEHEGATFIGRLSFESEKACQEIVSLLKQHRGKPVQSIGGLSVDLMDPNRAVASAA